MWFAFFITRVLISFEIWKNIMFHAILIVIITFMIIPLSVSCFQNNSY